MPIGSPGDVPATSLADLGLPGRAVTALTRAGITDVGRLALLSRDDLAAVPGLGPGLIAAIRLVVPGPPPPDVEQESPDAPSIPSFDSLRAPRGRSAVDLLTAGPPVPPPPS
uniref:DNA-directed RNA polymerase subunit alpha C-terminal domain-containing protein n=1 Tax=Modestobacter excelsi TaxID=2213161 RepID=UPI001C20C97D